MGLNELELMHQLHLVMRSEINDYIFQGVTFLGGGVFMLLMIATTWHLVDEKFNFRFVTVLVAAVFINVILKDWIQRDRPFINNPLLGVISEEGYSFPSGHAQISVVMWGLIAGYLREKWFYVFAVVVTVLIAFSRVYLGVHYPSDVIAGIITGASILSISAKLDNKFYRFFSGYGALLLPLMLNFYVLCFHNHSILCKVVAIYTGLILGFILTSKRDRTIDRFSQAAKIIVSIVGVLAIYNGYENFKPYFMGEDYNYNLFRYLCFLAIGLWISSVSIMVVNLVRFLPGLDMAVVKQNISYDIENK